MKFTSALFAVSFIAVASAKALDVFVPRIISPDATTVWTSGQQETVTWDTSDAPTHISNGAAVVFHSDASNTATVLAQNFDLRAGSVVVTVPEGSAGTAHITLFGDSGDNSPEFTVL